jgi:hypothetical protein
MEGLGAFCSKHTVPVAQPFSQPNFGNWGLFKKGTVRYVEGLPTVSKAEIDDGRDHCFACPDVQHKASDRLHLAQIELD